VAYFDMQGTGDWSTPDLRPKNYRQAAFKLFPDSPTPFTKFLSMTKSRMTSDPDYKIFEWRLPKMAWIMNGATAASTTTALTFVATGAETTTPAKGLKAGDLLKDETSGEIVLVSVDPADPWTTVEVVRHWGGTNAGAVIADASVMRWVGSAYSEGSNAPTAISRRATVVTNYTQIFKDTADVTGTAEQTEIRPMKPWPQLKGEALERHMQKMELALLHGVQYETTGANGKPLRTTGGFRTLVVAGLGSAVDMSALSVTKLENALQTVFTYGSKRKMMLTGYTALNYINKVVRENTQFQFNAPLPAEQTYGLNVRELVCPFGTLGIIPHPLMAESALYTTEGYIIDPKYVEQVIMRGRDTKWKDNAEANDADERKGYYQTECGLSLALPEVHSVWTGMSSLA